ncbi:MAG TPA: GIY-YIG nuclease family protein [Cyclobacteriaceae bacterium]|nr:GIY-YIG nuclease family protein [Cyclobacteriaceae bacterium]HMV10206.1 GIY-YIG nuclease family protein [Cyclobacteriaceae bacterium]HMV89740.1 GIY-YIG nuclease family protein [Cyclobacteriaceae bacterium]HMX01543.1 GIY-YIG nuclease family protein [Cyclobacteriaceae bacterium]HMY92255.1 GIY-YIG nuclease family protein [Cyclobacteriaceae bacterium]
MWIVYVLRSAKSGKRYVGMTQDVTLRLAQHNSGKSKFTSGHMPWKLIYQETYSGSVEARVREKYLKSSQGRRFLDKELGAGSLPD